MDNQNRLLTILAVVLLVGVALLVFDPRKDAEPSPDGDGPPQHTLFGYKADAVESFSIVRSGVAMQFDRRDGDWVLQGSESMALDPRKVEEVLNRFATLKVEERDLKGPLTEYGLDDSARTELRIRTAEGKEHLAWIGVDSSVGYRTYIQEQTNGPVHLATSKVSELVQRRAEDFRATDVWSFSTASTRRIVFQEGGTTVSLRKDDHGWWLGDTGPRADDDAVRTWLYSVETLRAESFLDGQSAASVGLEPPAATVRIEDDAGTHTLELGPAGAGRVARGEHGLVRLGADAVNPVKLDGWVSARLLPVRRIQMDQLEVQLGDRKGSWTRAEGVWKDAAGTAAIAVDGLLDKIDGAVADRTGELSRPAAPWGTVKVGEGTQRVETVHFGPSEGGWHVAWDANGGPPFRVSVLDVQAIAAAIP